MWSQLEMVVHLEADLENNVKWEWLVSINATKTQCISFPRSNIWETLMSKCSELNWKKKSL